LFKIELAIFQNLFHNASKNNKEGSNQFQTQQGFVSP